MTTEVVEVTTEPLTARDLNLTILDESYDDICLLIIDPQVSHYYTLYLYGHVNYGLWCSCHGTKGIKSLPLSSHVLIDFKHFQASLIINFVSHLNCYVLSTCFS